MDKSIPYGVLCSIHLVCRERIYPFRVQEVPICTAVPTGGNGLPRPEGLAMTTTGSLYGVGSFSSFRPPSVVIARSVPQAATWQSASFGSADVGDGASSGRMISAPTGVDGSASSGRPHRAAPTGVCESACRRVVGDDDPYEYVRWCQRLFGKKGKRPI